MLSTRIAVCRRYMANASLFRAMTDLASGVAGTRLAVGGNAPVMVNRILREGVRVLLGAQMTDALRTQISPDVEGWCNMQHISVACVCFSFLSPLITWQS